MLGLVGAAGVLQEVEVAGVRMREAQKQLKSSLQEAQARVTQLEAELMAINNVGTAGKRGAGL